MASCKRSARVDVGLWLLCIAALLVASWGCGKSDVATVDEDPIGALHLIPIPRTISGDTGHLHFDSSSRIAVSTDTRAIGELLADSLRRSTGWAWNVAVAEPDPGDIGLHLDPEQIGEESYELVIDRRTARVTAATPAGVFYGTQTLLQLLPSEVEESAEAEGVHQPEGAEGRTDRDPERERRQDGVRIGPAGHADEEALGEQCSGGQRKGCERQRGAREQGA